ncbi:MAG: hypothetical protein JRF33_11560 [Deltaproteobacteria bacterium]|nr:hypothetical protein [Deltaproteobacteria bacterium]
MTLLLLFVLAPTVTLRLLDERDLARHAQQAARLQRATAQLEGARTAWLRGMPMEARSKLRAALEIQDTPAGRGFFREMAGEALMMQFTMTDQGHKVDFSPKGLRLAVGSNVGQVYLADLANMDVRVLRGQTGRVSDVAFSPDGTRLATCSHEGTVRLLRLQGQESSLERQFEAPVARALDFSPDGRILAVGGGDRLIRFWDVDSGELIRVLEGHEDDVTDLAFDPGGHRLASASLDGNIGLWDVETGRRQRLLRGHEGHVYSLDFSPDGSRLISGGEDRTVRLWDAMTGEQERILTRHDDEVHAVVFQNTGKLIASASKEILIHDATSERELGMLGSHGYFLNGLDFSADGSLLASTGKDGKLRVWRTTGIKPRVYPGHESFTNFVAFSPDGRTIASASMDRSIRLWDRVSGQVKRVFETDKNAVFHLAFSPDGRWLVAGGRDEFLRIWDWRMGSGRLLAGHTGPAFSVAIRPDGQQLASGSSDGRIGLWSMPEGRLNRMLESKHQRIYSLGYSPDGHLLASGSTDGLISIWDSEKGEILHRLEDHESSIYGLVFSPDGRWLASAERAGVVILWRVADWQGRVLARMKSRAHYMDFSPDGRHLALAMADGHIHTWRFDSEQGSVTDARQLRAHPAEVNDVTFSPDGQFLASVGDDGSLRLWRLEGDRLRAAWRDGLALVDEQGRLTWSNHVGWFVHEAGETRGPKPAGAAWQKAVDESLRAEVSVKGRMICLQDGEGRLQFWDQQADAPLTACEVAGVEDFVALESGCAYLADGELLLFRKEGKKLLLADKVRALGSEDDGGFYALSASRILRYDPQGRLRASRKAPPAVSRVLWLEDGLLLGYKDGGLEFHPEKTGADVLHLDDLSAHTVTRLIRGPGRMVVAGFADGQVGMWDLSSGGRNLQARLHGGVRWLKLSRDGLLALSELGQVRLWDFRIFHEEHCDLLRKVWKDLPRIWEDGRPVLRGPDPEHPCMRRTD